LESRQPNTSLSVPQDPPLFGYQAVNAFPGLAFTRPVALVTQPGETNRLFVVEQAGRIFVITNLASPTKTLFLDISAHVDSYDEGGLLGMAFHPEWASNGRFFVCYTVSTNLPAGYYFYDRLASFDINPANANAALSDSEQFLISQLDQASNHNAGDIHFGTDGYLYLSFGDEGGGGDPLRNSQSINKDFFSAILRIDVDRKPSSLEPNVHPAIHTNSQGQAYYAIPPDNPFIGATSFNGSIVNPATVRTEFWAVGLRNPWRMSFDPVTGLLYCADVGQLLYEEVNIIQGGNNYGWNFREGLHPYSGTVPQGVALRDPIIEYPHSNGPLITGGVAQGISITGGIVYRGSRFSQLEGLYVFGDYGSGRIFALRYNPDTDQAEDFQQLTSATQPVAFGADPSNGDILIARLGGTISRLIYSNDPVQGQPLPSLLSETGAFSDLATLAPHPGIIPYDLNLPFWSDYALKSRWFSIPNIDDTMTFSPDGNWLFPTGTVWIKHFGFEFTNGVPSSRRRLETRFLVKNDDGVHGFTYKWNPAQTDADLVPEGGSDETLTIYNPDGSVLREQLWSFPSRGACLQCHTSQGGYALGFNTVQLNRLHDYGSGPTNQIAALSNVGYFSAPVGDVSALPALSTPDDTGKSLEHRVRSYLQANCVQCHQPGGPSQGNWDARFATPTELAGLIDGPLVNTGGDPANRVLAPNDPVHSILLQKMSTRGPGQMPPLASEIADPAGMALLTEWIHAGLPTGTLIPPDITWNNPSAITYGVPLTAAQLNAQANVAGTFSYSPPLGTVLNAGVGQVLSVTFTPDEPETYSTALATVTLNVNQAALTITADNKSKTYGAANPALTAAYSGFVNGDTSAGLDTPVNLATTAVTGSPVGSYPITPSGAVDTNYTITHTAGSLTVNPALLTVTAENKSRTYGAANPVFSATYAVFVNGEDPSVLDASVVLSTSATAGSPVGSYPITATGAADANYTVTHVNGSLSVTPAALTITAENKSKVEGQSNPHLTASYNSFVNGETAATLDNPVILSTTALLNSLPGLYPITASGAADANYQITFVPGTLTVEANAQFVPLEIGQGNRVTIRVTGHPGRTYRIQWSPDLDQWNEFAPITTDGSGVGTYVEPTNPAPGNRYFRILWP